jgi:type I restriction enzyme, S subunit
MDDIFSLPRWAIMPEFDRLPPDWELAPLTKIAKLIAGQSPPSESYNEKGEGLPFLQGNADFADRFPVPRIWCSMPKKVCNAGATLISVRAPVGELNRADRSYALGRGLAALEAVTIDPDYLYYGMTHWRTCLQRVGQGTTFDAVTARHFARMMVPVPPPEEQREIARILDAVDAAIDRTRTAIDQACRLKRGLMQELLPPWIGFKRISPESLGKGIEVLPGHKVARIVNGSTPSRESQAYWRDGTIPWLATGKVNEKVIRHADEHVTRKALTECSIELLPPGTVLVGMIGQGKTRGMAAYLDFEACINQNFGAFIPGPRLVGKWLYHYFYFHYTFLREVGGGTNQGALNCYLLKRIRLPILPKDTQIEIATRLDACDAKIASYMSIAKHLDRLKRGLMQDLLTGKVPVKQVKSQATAPAQLALPFEAA